jgi:membrane protease YdiL (CAAX protease family)
MLSLLLHPPVVFAALLTLAPFFSAAFCPRSFRLVGQWPLGWRIIAPALLGLPYALVAGSDGLFHWAWFALYTLLPVLITVLLYRASLADPEQHGDWREFLILAFLGLAVDLRWFEPAWGPRLAIFNKILLLDAGIYGFLAIRQLDHVGFDLRLRLRDVRTGLLALALYAPIAIALGLALGFLHFHAYLPSGWHVLVGWIFTFFFIAVPEELFFRGWMQNLLERRVGQGWALLITAVLFGLSHFNKRAVHFNWRYVLLAFLAGIFYGRAWRQERRVGASAVTHASVDTLWSIWLR